MESVETPLTRFVIHSEVVHVEEEFKPAYIVGSGIGAEAQFINQSLGYFAYFKGSHEALHLGMDKPTLAKGDKVKITVEKVI